MDVHCVNCKQVIVPPERMKPLSQLVPTATMKHAEDLYVIKAETMVILNCDFVCPNCGRSVYFRLNEQKLNLLLDAVVRR